MKLSELEALYRFDACDNAKPPFVSKTEVALLFSEAEREACIRADLLREADDPSICRIAIPIGAPAFDIDRRVTRVAHATFTPTGSDTPQDLRIVVDRRQLDTIRPRWRTESMEPRELLIEQHRAQLGCLPVCAGVVSLECFRLPRKALIGDGDEPEISEVHHIHLVQWVLKRAFARPDGDLLNPGAAAAADEAFTAYFGIRPDAELRQPREATPEYNVAQW